MLHPITKDLSRTTQNCVALLLVAALAVASGCAQGGEGQGETSTAEIRLTTAESSTTQQRGNSTGQTTAGERVASGGEGATTVEATRAQEEQNPEESEKQKVTVRVGGSEGLPFDGNLGVGQELERVQGTTPETYELEAGPGEIVVAASIRKRSPEEGAMRVEVLRDGKSVASQETSGAAGMVNVVWSSENSSSGG